MIGKSVTRQIWLGFGIGLLILATIAIIAVRSIDALLDDEGMVVHTNDVLTALDAVQDACVRGESAQRAYVVTPQMVDVREVEHARNDAAVGLLRLARLVRDNPAQELRAETLATEVHRKFEFITLAVRLVEEQHRDSAVALMASLEGVRLMEAVHRQVDSMSRVEQRLLTERRNTVDAHAVRSRLLIGFGFLLSILIVAGFGIVAQRNLEARARASARRQLIRSLQVGIGAADSPREAFQELLTAVRIYTGWDYGEIWTPDSSLDVLVRSQIWTGETDADRAFARGSAGLAIGRGDGLAGRAWDSGDPVYAAELSAEPRFVRSELARDAGFVRAFAAPLVDERVVGVAMFHTRTRRPDDAQMARNVSDAIAAAGPLLRRKLAEAEARRSREEAEEANRAKSDFLARMSHELRTPLNSVIGFANVLIKNKSGSLNQQDLLYADRIRANGRHLLDLINSVLDLAKVESGRSGVEVSDVDVGALAREIVAEMDSQVADRDVQLLAEVPASLAPLRTDRHKLKQVMMNLIANALKFTTAGSIRVRITALPNGAPARIDVVDTGIGIPANRRDAIFSAFEQADVSTSRKFGGTGLGLAISRSMSELLGFELVVDSEVGVGSTFSILLMPQLNPYAIAGGRAGKPAGPSVLVVEDDPDARALIAERVRGLGAVAEYAANAEEALRHVRRRKPDVITMDVLMPGAGGLHAVRMLRADPATRGIPIIVVSVIADEVREEMQAIDAVVLQKPVQPELLDHVLREKLGMA